MLGANLLGFHTPSYVQAFLANCLSSGLGMVSENSVVIDSHVVRVGDFPMGIDYKKYANANKTSAVKKAVARFQRKYRGQKVIVAIDRLDPSKGLVERLKAYDEFLARTPKLRGKVVFSMVAAPSRTDIAVYQNLSKKLEKLVAEINKKYGTPRWQPVDYMNEAQPFEVVTALFQIADVAFIAPLKDGMNLAAKEFVASNRKNGALILSETAGAAEELHAALIVNPRQTASLVNALQRALTMQPAELGIRLRKMKRYIAVNSVQSWAKTFVETLQQPLPGTQAVNRTRSLTQSLQKQILQDYGTSKKRLFLLDYDGSLVPFANDRNDAKPPKRLLNLLEELSKDKRNDIVVVSGRSSKDLEKWLGTLPINLVAEHGASTKKAKQKWHNLDRSEERWKREIQPVLLNYAALTPGAQVEVKMHSLVWHYRSSPPYYAQKYAVTIKRVLKPLLKKYGVQLFQGNKVLEIKNPDISKGKALRKWLDTKHDFIFVVGDDFTDEDMFKAAPADSYTVKVGRGRTAARYRLESSGDVKKLLTQFTK
jgi:trehalose 6-phosphate synthase/phosphatase